MLSYSLSSEFDVSSVIGAGLYIAIGWSPTTELIAQHDQQIAQIHG